MGVSAAAFDWRRFSPVSPLGARERVLLASAASAANPKILVLLAPSDLPVQSQAT
jgi:hypothetical protein